MRRAPQMDALEEGPPPGAARVPCPLCREGRLGERHGVVLCSRGDLRLDLRAEGLTLNDVRCAPGWTPR